tara:strand:+ start:3395 stop:4870 length:1476 start_codon:yes stop_codon:yes gene_type:complete
LANEQHFDLVVIGSGPGGYVGAIRAAQLGMKTAIVERNRLGGVCLNWGCIPSKALLHVAEAYSESVTHGSEWGLSFEKASVDWSKVIASSRGAADKLNKGVGFLMKKNSITTIEGHARIKSAKDGDKPCEIEILKADEDYYHGGGSEVTSSITADRVMIATGAAPRGLPFAPFDGKTVLSSKEAMVLPEQPESMVVVGSGAIGMEFAYFYNAMGTKVTVIEMMDRIFPNEDEAVSKEALKAFKRQGIDFHVSSMTTAIDIKDDGATVTIVDANDESKTQQISAEKVLVGIGVQARCDGLLAEGLEMEMVKGYIKTDYRDVDEPTYETSLPGIYAIGDIIGPPWLAHVSGEEAVTCVERMAGHQTLGVDYNAIPGCTYTSPQIACIGMTEQAAKESGVEYETGTFSFQALGKAVATGATAGFVKIIVSKPFGEILGAHIIGADASELIHEFCLAIRLEATAEDIISTMHAHPTMSESIHEAALDTENRVINS